MARKGTGVNDRGNRWTTPGGRNSNSSTSYHYSNNDGSYFYKNDDGSTYFNPGRGTGGYYRPRGSPIGHWCRAKTENTEKTPLTKEPELYEPRELKFEHMLQSNISPHEESKP